MPSLHARWAEELLGRPLPGEAAAACERCELSTSSGGKAPSRFNPTTRCCTYSPRLPAYLVGQLLADPDPRWQRGRRLVEERIAAGAGVSRLGVGPTEAEATRYRSSGAELFGTGAELRCPYFLAEAGLCSIWPYRSAACTTWFCKHTRGAVSLRFWQALRRLLEAVEASLARHCQLELKPGAPAVEGEHFRACAAVVQGLAWSAVSEIGGAEVQLLARLVLDRFADLCSEEVPARLRAGTFTTALLDDGRVRLVSYRSLDPLDLPGPWLEALARFDGRPTDQVLRECADRGLEIDEAVVRRLVDFGILT